MGRNRKRERIKPFAFDLATTDISAEKGKARELRASQWWKRQCAKGVCHWCGLRVSAKELTMDHIVPISRGGKTAKNNVVPCCKTCNNQKKQLLPMEWEAYVQSRQNENRGKNDEQCF